MSRLLFRSFDRNALGNDYVVGDIHGCFSRLSDMLDKAGFDASKDRLFSVGDLVDRGPESERATYWLTLPWFHAVRGNHEQMAIEAALGLVDPSLHVINGGAWFYELSDDDRHYTAGRFARLPYAIEVETRDGTFGIVHAEVPGDDWATFRQMLLDSGEARPENFEHMERFALWGRDIIRGRSPFTGVDNIDRVYVGHTPVKEWQIRGNVHYIDTGGCFGHPLTMTCMTDGRVFREER